MTEESQMPLDWCMMDDLSVIKTDMVVHITRPGKDEFVGKVTSVYPHPDKEEAVVLARKLNLETMKPANGAQYSIRPQWCREATEKDLKV